MGKLAEEDFDFSIDMANFGKVVIKDPFKKRQEGIYYEKRT